MSATAIFVFEEPGCHWIDTVLRIINGYTSPLSDSLKSAAARVIRTEISRTALLRTNTLWNFVTLNELLGCIARNPQVCPISVRCALLCTSQLISYVSYTENKNLFCTEELPRTFAAGWGIGAITSAAIKNSNSVHDLVSTSSNAISASFRVGMAGQHKSTSILHDGTAPWASIQHEGSLEDAQDALKFFEEKLAYRGCACYVSAVRTGSTTISGPLNELESLRRDLGLVHAIETGIGPLHAPSLFLERDLVDLTRSSPIQIAALEVLCCVSNQGQMSKDLAAAVHENNVKVMSFDHGSFLEEVLHQICSGPPRHIEVIDLSAVAPAPVVTPGKAAIAVIGMSGRFPEAEDTEELWQILQAGRDVHRKVPPERFNINTHSDPTGEGRNTSKASHGCFIRQPGLFDTRFFNMSPKEAEQTDPAQRLIILTAYEALEMSGFVPNRTPSSREDRVGTFYGQASDDWREVNSSQHINTHFIPGGIRAFGPGRINYHLKFSGPSFSVDTACSSSFAAIHTACNALWAGDCDTAIAGGANILTNPDIYAGLSEGHFLSPTGSCKTFDASADGYCRADGVGSIVLKRLEDAEADNDNIIGVILGIKTNHSAHALSITHPHAATQQALYQSLLDNNGVDPYEIDYVEMHGTGTQAGDFHEMTSVSDVFAPRDRSPRKLPVYVGSAKANFGHAEAAAGIVSFIKVLQMMRKGAIPRHIGIKGRLNPALPSDLETRHLSIPLHGAIWRRRDAATPRTAFLNNFSAAGGNTAMILREQIVDRRLRTDPRAAQIITVTAKTIRSMQQNIKRLVNHIKGSQDLTLPNLAYTLTARRISHSLRKSFAVTTLEEAVTKLGAFQDASFEPHPARLEGVIFSFTGQGSLYMGVGKALFDTCHSFRRDLFTYDSIAQGHGLPSFLPLVTNTTGDIASLSAVVIQVGQVAVQVALANLWQSWGIKPKAVVGHSLGEYPALVVAGVLSASDMIYIVGQRSKLMEDVCSVGSHGMAIISECASVLTPKLRGSLEVSCDNGPQTVVIGGPRRELEDCIAQLKAEGLRCASLPTLYAYHTSQVDPILMDLRKAATNIRLKKPTIPILSAVLGKIVDTDTKELNAEYICRHARNPVQFRQLFSSMKGQTEWAADTLWLEIGPQPACIKLIQHNIGQGAVCMKSFDKNYDAWQTLSETVSELHDRGFKIEWEEFHRSFEDCHQLVELPAYGWDLRNYWIQYEHDWTLTKGLKPATEISETTPALSSLSTTSVQKVLREDVSNGEVSILCETDFSEPVLQKHVAGHKVNGIALCSSSVYSDMTYTVAERVRRLLSPNDGNFSMELCDLSVGKPFIVEEVSDIRFRIAATGTLESTYVQLYTSSLSDESQRTIHATCKVNFSSVDKWLVKSQQKSYLIQSRINALEQAAAQGKAHRIQRKLVYKLFSNFVDYNEDFQGIEELILDSTQLEARAKVVLRPVDPLSKHHISPTWIDTLLHLTGAVLNASDAIDTANFVYISEGFGSLRLLDTLKQGITYTTYTRMQNTSGTLMEGDLWIFGEENVVGIAKRIKFQRISRKIIDTLLRPRDKSPNSSPNDTMPIKTATALETNKRAWRVNTENEVTASAESHKTMTQTYSRSSVFDDVLLIISSQCGVDLHELADGSTLASFGIDSLLSLEILAKLRENVGLDLRSSVFLEQKTIGELRSHILGDMVSNQTETSSSQPDAKSKLDPIGSECLSLRQSASDSDPDFNGRTVALDHGQPRIHADSYDSSNPQTPPETKPRIKSPAPSAISYLLSGNLQTASMFLFLFPDGSGSATSYAELPSLGRDVAAFGLNCPYMTIPQEWKAGIEGVMGLYLAEVRRRQPKGPYNLAGWSAGGILAYQAAWTLQQQGERVDRLMLIDSPCPVALQPMPVKMFKFLDTIGLLGNASGTPHWVIPHFEATVSNLDTYRPLPFAPGSEPSTTLIWARHGVMRETYGLRLPCEPGDPAVMEWLLQDRTDFGALGWDTLIATQSIAFEAMQGHHFSMLKENVNQLGQILRRAMSDLHFGEYDKLNRGHL